jgi:hypothetical protein
LIIVERLAKRELAKQQQANFIVIWWSIIVKKVHNRQISLQFQRGYARSLSWIHGCEP